jgi:hypothetical protein
VEVARRDFALDDMVPSPLLSLITAPAASKHCLAPSLSVRTPRHKPASCFPQLCMPHQTQRARTQTESSHHRTDDDPYEQQP